MYNFIFQDRWMIKLIQGQANKEETRLSETGECAGMQVIFWWEQQWLQYKKAKSEEGKLTR